MGQSSSTKSKALRENAPHTVKQRHNDLKDGLDSTEYMNNIERRDERQNIIFIKKNSNKGVSRKSNADEEQRFKSLVETVKDHDSAKALSRTKSDEHIWKTVNETNAVGGQHNLAGNQSPNHSGPKQQLKNTTVAVGSATEQKSEKYLYARYDPDEIKYIRKTGQKSKDTVTRSMVENCKENDKLSSVINSAREVERSEETDLEMPEGAKEGHTTARDVLGPIRNIESLEIENETLSTTVKETHLTHEETTKHTFPQKCLQNQGNCVGCIGKQTSEDETLPAESLKETGNNSHDFDIGCSHLVTKIGNNTGCKPLGTAFETCIFDQSCLLGHSQKNIQSYSKNQDIQLNKKSSHDCELSVSKLNSSVEQREQNLHAVKKEDLNKGFPTTKAEKHTLQTCCETAIVKGQDNYDDNLAPKNKQPVIKEQRKEMANSVAGTVEKKHNTSDNVMFDQDIAEYRNLNVHASKKNLEQVTSRKGKDSKVQLHATCASKSEEQGEERVDEAHKAAEKRQCTFIQSVGHKGVIMLDTLEKETFLTSNNPADRIFEELSNSLKMQLLVPKKSPVSLYNSVGYTEKETDKTVSQTVKTMQSESLEGIQKDKYNFVVVSKESRNKNSSKPSSDPVEKCFSDSNHLVDLPKKMEVHNKNQGIGLNNKISYEYVLTRRNSKSNGEEKEKRSIDTIKNTECATNLQKTNAKKYILNTFNETMAVGGQSNLDISRSTKNIYSSLKKRDVETDVETSSYPLQNQSNLRDGLYPTRKPAATEYKKEANEKGEKELENLHPDLLSQGNTPMGIFERTFVSESIKNNTNMSDLAKRGKSCVLEKNDSVSLEPGHKLLSDFQRISHSATLEPLPSVFLKDIQKDKHDLDLGYSVGISKESVNKNSCVFSSEPVEMGISDQSLFLVDVQKNKHMCDKNQDIEFNKKSSHECALSAVVSHQSYVEKKKQNSVGANKNTGSTTELQKTKARKYILKADAQEGIQNTRTNTIKLQQTKRQTAGFFEAGKIKSLEFVNSETKEVQRTRRQTTKQLKLFEAEEIKSLKAVDSEKRQIEVGDLKTQTEVCYLGADGGMQMKESNSSMTQYMSTRSSERTQMFSIGELTSLEFINSEQRYADVLPKRRSLDVGKNQAIMSGPGIIESTKTQTKTAVKQISMTEKCYKKITNKPQRGKIDEKVKLRYDTNISVSDVSNKTDKREDGKSQLARQIENRKKSDRSSPSISEKNKNVNEGPLAGNDLNILLSKSENSEATNSNLTTSAGNFSPERHAKNKSLQSSRTNRAVLYVYLPERAHANANMEEYLSHRMGTKDIPFQIAEVSNKCFSRNSKDETKVTLIFATAQKAQKALRLLYRSNKVTDKKLTCSFKNKEDDDIMERALQLKADFDRCAKQIVETAKTALDKHDVKIRAAVAALEKTERNLSQKRGVSLEVFSLLLQEKQAREGKIDELKSQRKEFEHFLQNIKGKLYSMKPSEKEKIIDLRKSLGSECHKLETALPMYARKGDILKTMKSSRVSVILGETGSGKSTQLVQYLYQSGYADSGMIACTQPRKIAAISLAEHVSGELASRMGQIVGYHVGMKSCKSKDTKIIFMTDQVLLNECLKDTDLSEFRCIIIDEAHERSIYTDLLLGILKKCLVVRSELQVVITSATIDPDIFVSYFGGDEKCPVLQVSGRTFPVEINWDDDVYSDPFPEDYERKAVDKAVEVHFAEPVDAGDILAFVTSPAEAERCCERCSRQITDRSFKCLQLHGKLKPEEQQQVFKPFPNGVRKIIFATNSAETSITIPGIKYVIDTGVVKEMRYDPKKKMNCLNVVPVSQSSSNQRLGRAGRTAPGTCYRLYSQNDFERMEKTNKPEILRVNLGQAILKLLHLKVDPLAFDFVESPNKTTMSTVMNNLRQLGAVEGNLLTDLGKWIANLPLEPRLGVLVKKGLDLQIPIEAIVVATCSSAGSVFYRAGSLEEKKRADLAKIKFCHPGGDFITILNLYREWNALAENAKGKWCLKNSINGKTMKGIRESVKEILDILKKEMNIEVKYKFSVAEKADQAVQKLIVESMISNVCFFLGHARAGYITTDILQHVQIHPSSSLVSLGQQPKWIIYDQLLKTSEDFVTYVTPAADEDVETYIAQGHLSFSREDLDSRVVTQICKIPVGKYTFWKFVGPLHKGRREKEEVISSSCDGKLVVIEADKQKGEITVYAVSRYGVVAERMIKRFLNIIPEQLKSEAREIPIGNDKCGVRAVLGQGGCIADLLGPSDFRSLNIKQKRYLGIELNEEVVFAMLSSYGPVDQVWKTKGKKGKNHTEYWGKVCFLNGKDAIAAEDDINSDKNSLIEVVPIRAYVPKTCSEFTVRVTWCRRRGKGIAYVYVDYPEDENQLLEKSPVVIGNKEVDIQHAKRNSNLMLRGLSAYISEDEIKEALVDILDVNIAPNSTRFKVIIPREQAAISARETDTVNQQLATVISSIPLNGQYRVNIKDVREQTARFTAFICFTDLRDCEALMEECTQGTLRIGNAPIDASMNLKTSIVIQRPVFDVIKVDLDIFTQKMHRRSTSTTIKRRELKSGNIVVDINSTSPRKLARAKSSIHDIVDGDCLDGETHPNLHRFFTKSSKHILGTIEKNTKTLILLDQRTFRMTVFGSLVARQTAVQEIIFSVESLADVEEVVLIVKGESSPPGVMKALIVEYGTNLRGLKEAADLDRVLLDYKLHKITMTGQNEAITKGCEIIQSVKKTLSSNKKVEENEMPDCPICICPVELSQIYRLEYCGHAYCRDCLKDLILNAVNEKKFPVECLFEECGKEIMIRDINLHIKQGHFTCSRLVAAAVKCLVAKPNSRFHYCLSPNCEMIYKITSPGELFECPLCFCRICTACHTQYHDGMSCAMYKSARKQDDSVKKWISEDPRKRKRCPSCDIGIEKIEGCNNVTCEACKAHICWKCLQYFDKISKCYKHLNEKHGSFMD